MAPSSGSEEWDVPLTELQLAQAIIRHMTRRVDLLKMWPVVLAAILVGVAISLVV
jgi:hypothetical protein